MSVAAHVSKVSKDYSPYGYSILEEVTKTVTTLAAGAGTDPIVQILNIVSDADIFLEDVSVYALDAISPSNTNFITVKIASFPAGAGSEVVHVNATTKADSLNGFSADGIEVAPILSSVVSSNPTQVLALQVLRSTDHADVSGRLLGIRVRYRRKA
jgi:hypothetical protein